MFIWNMWPFLIILWYCDVYFFMNFTFIFTNHWFHEGNVEHFGVIFTKYRVSTDYWRAVIPSDIPQNTISDRYNGQNTEYWPTWKKGGNSRMIWILYLLIFRYKRNTKWVMPFGQTIYKDSRGILSVYLYKKNFEPSGFKYIKDHLRFKVFPLLK